MKNTDSLNLDLSIRFFEDLLGLLNELKERREKSSFNPEEKKPVVKNVIQSDVDKLINDPKWPVAICETLICDKNSETDKTERAEGIASSLLTELPKRVLDFGCGEGHLALKLKENSFIRGYDIRSTNNEIWKNPDLLTTDFSKIMAADTFDTVIFYDVLDHIENETPSEALNKAASVLAPNGKIIIRCHPWCSRHGGHLYNNINKAFIHLVLTSEELEMLKIPIMENQKVLFPLRTYREWIEKAGLKIKSEYIDRQSVEGYFTENEVVKNRILNSFGRSNDFPVFQLEQNFIDITCSKE